MKRSGRSQRQVFVLTLCEMSTKLVAPVVIGIDASTNVVGVCVVDASRQVVAIGRIDLRATKDVWKKAEVVQGSFVSLRDRLVNRGCQIEFAYIEQHLFGFRPGLSNAKTLISLARWNGIVSCIARAVFCVDPVLVGSAEVRRAVGIKLLRGPGSPDTKDQVIDHVIGAIGDFWLEFTNSRKSETVRRSPVCSDMADAYVVCAGGHALKKALISESQRA